jgi:hypothetical protein
MRTTAIAFVFLLLAGCGTTGSPLAEYRKLKSSGPDKTPTSLELSDALEKDYQAALATCDTQMAKLRTAFVGSDSVELGLAAVGIIAGSIVVPVLAAKAVVAKSAIAGWGGVSGATNAAQYALQQKGASAAAEAAVYEGLRVEIKTQTAAYSAAGSASDADRVKAINLLAIACRYPALPTVAPPEKSASGGST